ncbi:MAG: hypothetical protein U0T73_12670 [Chitinophagales bacterium]
MEDTTAYKEGKVAATIESQTAKIPSDVFLWTALGISCAATTLFCLKQRHTALFVGQLIAPVLLLGVYNKLVKQNGHDQSEPALREAMFI